MAKKNMPQGNDVQFRFAKRDDVPIIVKMLSDDSLGANREETSQQGTDIYFQAFEEMTAQGDNHYLLAVNPTDSILGCVQITFISGLSRAGMKRAQIEGVRVTKAARGKGVGKKLMEEAHALARKHGCGLVQLTTDRSRTDALRFYEQLGYTNSHHGMKLLF